MPDKKWFFAGFLFFIVVIIAIFANLNATINDATKVSGTIDVDNGDININWNRYSTTDIRLSESVKITEPGIYHLTGTLDDGYIAIDVGENGIVKLILDNTNIRNSSGPVIACNSAEDLVIELIGYNNLEDGESYSNDFDSDIKGAIYSKADLSFTGNGILDLIANHEDGIISKDDLKFNSGIYYIDAADDAIRGTDSVYIVSGQYQIKSGADSIKSTNETTPDKGFVLIENGTLDLTSAAKGIKAINSILIQNGNFNINSYDDAIHSNNYVGIIDGTITISSSDDGIHADRELIIDNGKIDIAKSYEGLEAQKITINNGNLSITSTDDGINAGGGNDGSANNRTGAGAFKVDENCEIIINNGTIAINANGDGIDSNGAVYINNGKVTVDGPTNNGNGALDAGTEVSITGGEVVAVGSSGMAVALSSSSSIFNASIFFSSVQPAGTTVEIKNSTDQIIISHTSLKSFSHMTVGSEKFILGETYTIYINGEKYQDFTISNITTTIGTNKTNQNIRSMDNRPMPEDNRR